MSFVVKWRQWNKSPQLKPSKGDVVRQMRNEELAQFLANQQIGVVKSMFEKLGIKFDLDLSAAKDEWLAWLNSEVKDGEL